MKLPLVHNVILFAIIVEKTLEFVFFRRLMKILEQQHYAEHFQNTNVKGTINTNCDTDDEVVVFEKISQSSGQSTIYDYGTKQTPTSVA
ncbi:unnamed protein product [Toxocara canis]|nr:unnamed protein product [Toxocara canis]